jgi:hypothetical protein
MTHEFYSNVWIPSQDDFMILVTPRIPLDEKPIIQVYHYPNGDRNLPAVLINVKQVHYLEVANLITIMSSAPFDGYVVIK